MVFLVVLGAPTGRESSRSSVADAGSMSEPVSSGADDQKKA